MSIPIKHNLNLIDNTYDLDLNDVILICSESQQSKIYYIANKTLNTLTKLTSKNINYVAIALLYFTYIFQFNRS